MLVSASFNPARLSQVAAATGAAAWQYSNTGFVVAGRVLEKATGVPVIDFLRTRIFSRLGMESVYDLDHQPLTRADAAGYIRYAIGPLQPVTPEASGWLFAAGELSMTARDLALWMPD